MGKKSIKFNSDLRTKLQGTRIPADVSVISILKEHAKKEPKYLAILNNLELTVQHFEILEENREQAMESIQRFSMLLTEQSFSVKALSESPTEDELVVHKLIDMVEYFHKLPLT